MSDDEKHSEIYTANHNPPRPQPTHTRYLRRLQQPKPDEGKTNHLSSFASISGGQVDGRTYETTAISIRTTTTAVDMTVILNSNKTGTPVRSALCPCRPTTAVFPGRASESQPAKANPLYHDQHAANKETLHTSDVPTEPPTTE